MESINIGHAIITIVIILLFVIIFVSYMTTEWKDVKKQENEEKIRKESTSLQDYLSEWNFLWR